MLLTGCTKKYCTESVIYYSKCAKTAEEALSPLLRAFSARIPWEHCCPVRKCAAIQTSRRRSEQGSPKKKGAAGFFLQQTKIRALPSHDAGGKDAERGETGSQFCARQRVGDMPSHWRNDLEKEF